MRIIVMLSPTNKRGTKTAYTQFRRRLTSEGFVLLQPELFMRVVPNRKATQKYVDRLKTCAPTTGTVSLMILTERQYLSIHFLAGGFDYQEQVVGARGSVSL
jgi:CRISPR-associated protein Cas2